MRLSLFIQGAAFGACWAILLQGWLNAVANSMWQSMESGVYPYNYIGLLILAALSAIKLCKDENKNNQYWRI